MAPSTPKRPPRSPAETPPAPRRKPELPFDDDAPPRVDARPSRAQTVARKRPELPGPVSEVSERSDAEDRRITVPESPGTSFSEAHLYVERGPGAGQAVPIAQGLIFIGRASTSGLRIQHASVSRRHAQLTRNGERFFIRDLASQNGTYVNQVRIDKEVEIFAGDELVMGTAQLRLRGPPGSSASAKAPRKSRGAKRGRGSGVTGIAIAAAGVGFGLAALVAFAYFRMGRGPSYEDMGDAPRLTAERPAPAKVTPPQEPQPAKHKPPEEKPDPRSGATPLLDATATPAPVELVPEPEEKPTPRPALTPKVVVRRIAQQARASAAREAEPAIPGDPAVLARFEAGNVKAAIELAKKKPAAKELLARLTRFQGFYDAGERALAAQDEAGALKNLDAALKTAEHLSGGWDKYSTELRHQLSGLHLMAGMRLVERDPAAARKALGTALQYDPENSKAKEQLARLDPSGASKDGKKKAIDAAFGN